MTLPTWLEETPITITQSTVAPNISTPQVNPLGKYPATRSELTYQELQYENLFESALDQIMEGVTLTAVIRNDPRGIDYGKFQAWIRKDKDRKRRYYEAKEIGSEKVEDELIDISDATDNPMEDVARSTLRIATRKWLLGVWDKRRYGDEKNAPNFANAGGGITINIGTVDSPYTIENQSDQSSQPQHPQHPQTLITDVEMK